MKILLTLIPLLNNVSQTNSLINLIKTSDYHYNLNNLKSNHSWDKDLIWKNDVNINLYGLSDIGLSTLMYINK